MKKILLVGGSGTIGYFWASELVRVGQQVLLTCTDKKKFAAKDKLALFDHENVNLLELNVNTADDVDKFFHDHKGSLHDVDILVNNARNPGFLQVKDGEFSTADALLDEYLVDVVLPYRMSVLLAGNSSLSVVVNVGSIYGNKTFKERIYDDGWRSAPIQYSLAKAALNKLTEELAVRLASHNVRVNGLALGGVLSEQPNNFIERYGQECARNGMLSLEDTLAAFQFLLADENDAMTGQTLHVDNGFSVK